MDIEGILAITLLFGGGTLVGIMYSPVGAAIADRLRGRHVSREAQEEVDALKDQVAALHGQVSELAERQDFAERLLAQHKERGTLGAGQP